MSLSRQARSQLAAIGFAPPPAADDKKSHPPPQMHQSPQTDHAPDEAAHAPPETDRPSGEAKSRRTQATSAVAAGNGTMRRFKRRVRDPCYDGAGCKRLFAMLCRHFDGKNPNKCAVKRRLLWSFRVEDVACKKGAEFYGHSWDDVCEILRGNKKWGPLILAKQRERFDCDLDFKETTTKELGHVTADLTERKEEREERLERADIRRSEIAYLERAVHFDRVWKQAEEAETKKLQHLREINLHLDAINSTEREIRRLEKTLAKQREDLKELKAALPKENVATATAAAWRPIMPDKPLWECQEEMERAKARLEQLQTRCSDGMLCKKLSSSWWKDPEMEWGKHKGIRWAKACPHYHPPKELKAMHIECARQLQRDLVNQSDQWMTWVGPESIFVDRWLRWLWEDWFQPDVCPGFTGALVSIVLQFYHGSTRFAKQMVPSEMKAINAGYSSNVKCAWAAFTELPQPGDCKRNSDSSLSYFCDIAQFCAATGSVKRLGLGESFVLAPRQGERRTIHVCSDTYKGTMLIPFCSDGCRQRLTHTAQWDHVPHTCDRKSDVTAFEPFNGFHHDAEKCRSRSADPQTPCRGPTGCPRYFQEAFVQGCPGCNHFRHRDLQPIQ